MLNANVVKGEILEGGENLVDVITGAEALEDYVSLNLIELALHIENSAFDLYRTMADKTEFHEAEELFIAIAQAEKKHMKSLVDVIGHCE